MDHTPFPFKEICLLIVSLFLITIITFAQDSSSDGHKFMADTDRCSECHLGTPVFGVTDYRDLRFTDDIVNICHKCHSEESLGRSHPVNIRPKEDMEIPEDLHLDEYLSVTCATCHQPHGEYFTTLKPTDFESPVSKERKRLYRSYYLRRTNIQNALCYACHKK